MALGLVLLIAHAAAVTVTHHHTQLAAAGKTGTIRSDDALSISNSDGSAQAPLSGGDSQCLSCSLQRNIISEIRPASFLIAIIPFSYQYREAKLTTPATGTILILSNRAPPVA